MVNHYLGDREHIERVINKVGVLVDYYLNIFIGIQRGWDLVNALAVFVHV